MRPHRERVFRERPVVIKGIHAIEEALEAGRSIEKILLQRGARSDQISALVKSVRQREIPVQEVPVQKLMQFGAAHQGIVAIISPIAFYKTEEVLVQAYERGEDPLFVVCDGITDVRNFGAIARTAHVAGVHAIVIPQTETASINAEAVKASAGALMNIPVCRERNLLNAVKNMKLHGIQILAAEASGSKFIFECDLKIPTAVIVGSEGEGISKELLILADDLVKIPMANNFNSYNVSVAAGMILYEVMKQRMNRE
jgi:23S rRNA (guanosine2251-2'-O)-methyltransferase